MTRLAPAVLLSAVAYVATGKLSLLLVLPPSYACVLWPPAGVALVSLLSFGYRAWPGVALGATMINLWRMAETSSAWPLDGISLLTAATISMGSAAQAMLGTWLIRRYVGSPGPLDTARDIAWFSLLGGVVACLVNAIWGPLILASVGWLPWDLVVENMWLWWIGDVLGAVVVSPLLLTLSAEPRAVWQRRRISLGAPLAGILALSLSLFVIASAREADRLRAEFQRRAARVSENLSLQFQRRLDSLQAVASLLLTEDQVDAADFAEFAGHLLASAPGFQALEWVAHEPGGQAREARYPVRFVVPRAGRELAGHQDPGQALGQDLGTQPEAREAIRVARETGRPALTAAMRLTETTSPQQGFLLFLPVYEQQRLRGLVAGVVHQDELLEAALAGVVLHGVHVRLLDLTTSSTQPLYNHTIQGHGLAIFQGQSELSIAGHQWRIELLPTMAAIAQERSWQAPGVLVAGMLVAILLGALLLLVTGHTVRAETQAAERAGELDVARRELAHTAFLRRLADSNVIGIVITDRRGNIYEGNEAFLRMIGLSREDLAQGPLRWDALTPPEWHDADRQAIGQLMASGMAPAWEKEYLHKDGTRVPVMIGVANLDDAGERGVGFVVDLTQVKQAEAALKRQAAELERYRLIVDSVPGPIIIKEYSAERQGVYILANPISNEAAGVDSLIGLTDVDVFPEEIAASLQAHDREVLARDQAMTMEEVIRDRHSGKHLYLLVTKMPLRNAEGQLFAIAAVSLDITAQKQLNERLSALVDAIPDGMLRIHAQGICLDFKNLHEAMLAVPADGIIGKHLDDTPLPEDFRQWAAQAIPRAIESGQIQELEYRMILPHGERYYEARVVKSGMDEVVVLLRDITEPRRARAELEAINTRLRAVNEELAQFAYVASHDLQEPLRTVTGFVELLETRYRNAFDEKGQKWLHFVVGGTQRMRALIEDLLMYSRAGQPGGTMLVDTGTLVTALLDDMRAGIEATQAEVHVGPLPTVMANETELWQVFQNLISNALKFHRQDVRPRVTITAEPLHGDGSAGWAFTVADNGIGIEAVYHERIFQVFQRLHERERYPGTGIGLALVKKIINRQGGEITVHSIVGEGSAFRFTLPRGRSGMSGDDEKEEEHGMA